MNNFPKGNDLIVKWAIKYSDGTPFPLENYAWELCYSAGRGINVVKDTAVISASDNLLTWRFSGKDQAFYGKYSLTLRLYQQGKIVATVRKNNAFELSTTQYDGPCDIDLVSYCDNISLQDALLRGNRAMEVAQGAKDIAGSAVKTAGGAVTTANEAKNIASTANNTSTEAKTIASNAKTVADQAKATADATAATATQKAEEVAQKEAQLEAALNNLSTDQSGALALSTKVNEHGEKLSEIECMVDEKANIEDVSMVGHASGVAELFVNADKITDVSVDGASSITIRNTNMFEARRPTSSGYGCTLTNNGDGSFTLNGTATSSSVQFLNQLERATADKPLSLHGKYTLQMEVMGGSIDKGTYTGSTLFIWGFLNSNSEQVGISVKTETHAFTTEVNADNIVIGCRYTNGVIYNNFRFRLNLVKGEDVKSFVKYIEPTILTDFANIVEVTNQYAPQVWMQADSDATISVDFVATKLKDYVVGEISALSERLNNLDVEVNGLEAEVGGEIKWEEGRIYDLRDEVLPSSSTTRSGFRCARFSCKDGDVFILNAQGGSNIAYRLYGFADENGIITRRAEANKLAENLPVVAQEGEVQFVINDNLLTGISYFGEVAKNIYNDLRCSELGSSLTALESKVLNNCFIGIGSEYTSVRIDGLIPNHVYRVYIKESWENSSESTTDVKFGIYSNNGSSDTTLRSYKIGGDIPSYIDITIPSDSKYIEIGGRANIGVKVWFNVEDLWLKSESDMHFSELESTNYVNYFTGVGTSYVRRVIEGIIPNHKYRIYLQNPSWGVGTDNTSAVKFAVAYYVGMTYNTLVNVKVGKDVKPYYDFIAPDSFDSFEIGGRVNDGEKVWFYIVDAENTSNNIVILNGGIDELTSKFADLCKRKGISGNTNYGNKIWNILFTSDAHNKTKYIDRIIEFKNVFAESIDDILHGGDGVYDKFTDANPFDSILGGNLVINTIGNHECYDPSNTTGNAVNGFAQSKPVYDKFIAPYISNWGDSVNPITQPANASEYGYCYYYKDYTEAKVRLIVLDCMHYDDAQNAWLSEVLDNAIENEYHVVICNHYTPANTFIHDTKCTFDSIYDDGYAVIRASLNKSASDTVQSKIDSGLNFVCWLFGHFHKDLFGALSDYPKQFCLAVDKTAPGAGYDRDSCRSGNGKEQDAFDVISVDTSHGLMTVMRIGNNRDKFMRQKNYMVLDYINGKLISNS